MVGVHNKTSVFYVNLLISIILNDLWCNLQTLNLYAIQYEFKNQPPVILV